MRMEEGRMEEGRRIPPGGGPTTFFSPRVPTNGETFFKNKSRFPVAVSAQASCRLCDSYLLSLRHGLQQRAMGKGKGKGKGEQQSQPRQVRRVKIWGSGGGI